jgi:hypothetical protein
MADKPPSPAAAAGTPPALNKMEAVKRALAKLGDDAPPLDIQAYVKRYYKIDMTTDHVSNYKGKILREKAGGDKAKAKGKPAAKAPAAKPTASPAAASAGTRGISLKDIEAVKGLVGRVGPDQLRSLVDLLAK